MTDFRALCANLTIALNDWQYESGDDRYADLIDRARAALAEQPVRPTDEEIRTLAAFDVDFDCFETTDERGNVGNAWECSDSQLLDFVSAVLARWGYLTPQPVAVSERLPGPEDCDEQGRCWMSTTATDPGWVLDYPERCTNWTHWLSANALPAPEAP